MTTVDLRFWKPVETSFRGLVMGRANWGTWMTHVSRMTLSAVLSFSCIGSSVAAAATLAKTAELEIRVYNCASVTAKTLSRAQDHAGRVLKRAGITLRWGNCAPSHVQQPADAACAAEPKSAWITLTMLSKSVVAALPLSHDAFGLTLASGILVFADQSGALARWYGFPESEVLAIVIVHELGHGLLGAGHTTLGLMRAHLDEYDIRAFAGGRLWFAQHQASLMRSRLSSQVGRIGIARLGTPSLEGSNTVKDARGVPPFAPDYGCAED